MSCLKSVLSLSVMAAGSLACASYELMLLPQVGTSRIVRFDPENGVALGAFGQQGVLPASYFVNAIPGGRATFSNTNGTTTYDFSTGAQISHTNYPAGRLRVPITGNGRFGTFGNITFDHRSGDTSGMLSLTTASPLIAVAPHSDTIGVIMEVNGASDLVYQRFNGSSLSTSTSVLAGSAWSPASLGQGQAISTGSSTTTRLPYRSSTGALGVVQITQTDTAASFSTFGLAGGSSFATAAILNVLPSHIGFYVIGDDAGSATVTRIQHYSSGALLIGNYTTSAVDVPTTAWGGAIVLTPEPGSLAVLALGLIALSRRKKSVG